MSDLTCPKCSGPRDVNALYCPFCGVVFSRYEAEAAAATEAPNVNQVEAPPLPEVENAPEEEVEGLYDPSLYEQSDNPYEPPSATVAPQGRMDYGSGQVLAQRGTRLAARILDGLIAFAIMMIGMIPIMLVDDPEGSEGFLIVGGLFMTVGFPALLVINLRLLHEHGQDARQEGAQHPHRSHDRGERRPRTANRPALAADHPAEARFPSSAASSAWSTP